MADNDIVDLHIRVDSDFRKRFKIDFIKSGEKNYYGFISDLILLYEVMSSKHKTNSIRRILDYESVMPL